MDVQAANPTDFCMEVVSEDTASIFSGFVCGNEEIDQYFREQAQKDVQNVIYLYRNKINGDVIGAAAICCSGINVGGKALMQLIPAIKIDYFAIMESYHGLRFPGTEEEERFHYSDAFLCELVHEIHKIAERFVGARFIVLYSVPEAVRFYKRNLFSEFMDYMGAEQHGYIEGCEPMYMALL